MLLNNKYEYNPKTDLLGTGGFGRVYKARDTLLERDVALKMVNIEGAKAQYSLIKEIRKAINLHHNNIIKYYDVFKLKGESFTGEDIETQVGVMEYIPDGDISHLDWNNLPLVQQKDILLQILDGLNYLHHNKIIHRDIKPSNILIKKEGDRIIPKITDFGISKSQDAASVSVSRVIGSIPYMAPEQFDSKGRVSYNTDFWSLGILVYRLFTGTLPFGDESTTSEGVIMKNIMEAPMPQEVQQIPMPFRTLVELCLVKDRAERVKDAEILIEVLQDSQEKAQPLPEDLKTQATHPEDETDPTLPGEETTRILHYEPRKRASGAQKQASASVKEKGASIIAGQNIKNNKRKTVYWLMGLAFLLMIMIILGVQHFAGGKKELAATETTELSAREAELDTMQQQEQARLTTEREAEEQARVEAERRAEQQHQREERARIEEERRAEQQRQREEQALIEAQRRAEEERQRPIREWEARYGTKVVEVTNTATGRTWMDRNLGASRAATSSTDAPAYGNLYQWGRGSDGHQKRNSGNTSNLSNSDAPGYGNFILAPNRPFDWRSPQNNNLWQGANGINNPCPPGYRLPTEAEWNAERQSWRSNDTAGAFASPLKLPVAGRRYYFSGLLSNVGSGGRFWSSTVDGNFSRYLYFNSSNAGMGSSSRAYGRSVRCIKD